MKTEPLLPGADQPTIVNAINTLHACMDATQMAVADLKEQIGKQAVERAVMDLAVRRQFKSLRETVRKSDAVREVRDSSMREMILAVGQRVGINQAEPAKTKPLKEPMGMKQRVAMDVGLISGFLAVAKIIDAFWPNVHQFLGALK